MSGNLDTYEEKSSGVFGFVHVAPIFFVHFVVLAVLVFVVLVVLVFVVHLPLPVVAPIVVIVLVVFSLAGLSFLYTYAKLLVLWLSCTAVVKRKYSKTHSINSPNDPRTRAKLVSAICICLEQTFSEAHAAKLQLLSAFSKALDAYHGSAVQTAVDDELDLLPWPAMISRTEWENSDLRRRMVEIITTHRLRINSPAA